MKTLSHFFSIYNRKKKLKYVNEFIENRGIKSCLVVGAAQTNSPGYANLIERGLLEVCEYVVISGIEEKGIGWNNWVSCDGKNLPFLENQFDLVFSNAVVEHVGLEEAQRRYISEHVRVGKHWLFTTPNRLFPIESHTQVIFLHMFKSWNHPDVTRLLSRRDIQNLVPKYSKIRGNRFSPTFIVHCEC